MKKLTLIDASGFIFRAYHALPPLTNPKGVPVWAVLGFVNITLKYLEREKPDYIATIFDVSRQTFRNRIYPEYKAHRPPAPDDLVPQFALVREAARAMNLPVIELADYEADDIIATYAKRAKEAGIDVTIVSGDKDLMQCIEAGVSLYDPVKQKVIGAPEVLEKFGVTPDKVLDVLALMGDSSDNVPGVSGIGPKTASELINHYGDLEQLLTHAHEIKQPKRRETLLAQADQARMSKELVRLECNVPLPLSIESLAQKDPDKAQLAAFLQEHGFKSVLARIQGSESRVQEEKGNTPPIPQPLSSTYSTLSTEAGLAAWVAKARAAGLVAFDTETTGLNALQAELVGFSLAVENEACYVPLAHRVGSAAPADLFAPATQAVTLAPNQIPMERALALLAPLLADESVVKVGHNIKYDMHIMRRYGAPIAPIEDTMLLSYVLHAGEHGQGMDELSERYLNHKTITYAEVTGTGKARLRFDEVEIEKASAYAAEDAAVTLQLYHLFKPQVAQARLMAVYETMEKPLVGVLARMETLGIKVNRAELDRLSQDFARRMVELEREIHALAGHPFNVGSPKQLGEVLFDEMSLEGGRKSAKTGAYSTDNEVLETLAEAGHAIAQRVIDWRQLSKLKSTYTDALANQIDPATGRVHTNFAQAIASTGRLSSNDPNLQNIPIRSEEGKKIRAAFIAEEGNLLLSADYSQIELRLLAHMADIGTLKTAFRNGDDIHAITASQMFGVPVAQVSGDLRRSAKTINFGIIYGISAHGLAARLGIGRSEAAQYIEQYFRQYPGIRDYMEACKTFARAHDYVETLFKRRCHVPGINDKNAGMRQFSERAAINAPLQGTAADIIKRAMITIDKGLGIRDWGLGVTEDKKIEEVNSLAPILTSPNPQSLMPNPRLLLQVHDELVFEMAADAVEATTALIRPLMEGAASLSVPLTVEIGSGTHWGEAH